ncbi:4064_t:CDS:2, partial [Acaulospora colombiana]
LHAQVQGEERNRVAWTREFEGSFRKLTSSGRATPFFTLRRMFDADRESTTSSSSLMNESVVSERV